MLVSLPMSKYTKEILSRAAQQSTGVSGVLRVLGLKFAGGNHAYITKLLQQFGVDTTHFLGSASNRGSTHKGGPERLHHASILVKDRLRGRKEHAFRLRRALLEAGVPHTCAICCQGPTWRGQVLTLEVDHQNGDTLDNALVNLRFLCPNCHSQTANYGSKNHAIVA